MTFKEFLRRLEEGGMVPDDKANKAKPESATPTASASKWKYKLDNSGEAGGPGPKKGGATPAAS